MLNSVAAGRRQAARAIALQVVATLLVALACLWQAPRWSVAALVGGGAVIPWDGSRPGSRWGRRCSRGPGAGWLVAGVLAKWLVLVAVLVLGAAAFGLPPLPMLVAAVVVLAAQVVALALAR